MNIRLFTKSLNPLLLFVLVMGGGLVASAADGPRRTLVVQAVEKGLPSVVNIRTETVVEVKNGQKKTQGTYKDGWPHGPVTEWYETGQKRKEDTYKDGEKISEKQWDKDGNQTK